MLDVHAASLLSSTLLNFDVLLRVSFQDSSLEALQLKSLTLLLILLSHLLEQEFLAFLTHLAELLLLVPLHLDCSSISFFALLCRPPSILIVLLVLLSHDRILHALHELKLALHSPLQFVLPLRLLCVQDLVVGLDSFLVQLELTLALVLLHLSLCLVLLHDLRHRIPLGCLLGLHPLALRVHLTIDFVHQSLLRLLPLVGFFLTDAPVERELLVSHLFLAGILCFSVILLLLLELAPLLDFGDLGLVVPVILVPLPVLFQTLIQQLPVQILTHALLHIHNTELLTHRVLLMQVGCILVKLRPFKILKVHLTRAKAATRDDHASRAVRSTSSSASHGATRAAAAGRDRPHGVR
mmetsp:Transcript_14050/g.31126  ORF Transcript_14050/g.31126 Transcript_14050/m.31126 type:complete len:353 (+) Transcript_14050:387-1445(+)